MRNAGRPILAAVGVWALLAAPVVAGTLYVDDDAPAGGDGLSWATACPRLQDALAQAASGAVAEIRVAGGIYRPAEPGGPREATFQLIDGVALRGGYAGLAGADPHQRDIALYETILSGDLNGDDDLTGRSDNCYHVVTGSGTGADAVLDGFTITAGHADQGDWPNSAGAGLFCVEGGPSVMACTLTGNTAAWSGAGAFHRCGEPAFTSCRFIGNVAGGNGGGLYSEYGNAVLVGCFFLGNAAGCGGGACGWSGTGLLANCLFSGNKALLRGGALLDAGCLTLINCTVSGNTAGEGAGLLVADDTSVANCVFWGNTDHDGTDESAQLDGPSGTLAIEYTCVQGWTGQLGGVGNIGQDPLFGDPDGPDNVVGTVDDDLHLESGSPCVNAGSDYAVGPARTDLEGNPRVRQCRVDMGACESPHPPAEFEDCNGNGADDDCDLHQGASADCNRNHVPDECDLDEGTSADCNTNGIPDECDLEQGASYDCNGNGMPDECEGLSFRITRTRSCADHGVAGEFCLNVDGGGVEPRLPGLRKLVCELSLPMDPATFSVDDVEVGCAEGDYTGVLSAVVGDRSHCPAGELAIEFSPALPDENCCNVRIIDVLSRNGQPLVAELPVRLLAGDVDRDGVVTSIDAALIRPQFGWAVSKTNFWYDVTADGLLTTLDLSAIKPRFGRAAPSCP